MSGLYDKKEYFLLVHNDVEHIIDEPLGWDKVRISSPRDKDWYGFVSEYIGGDVQLTFPPKEGGDFIYNTLEQNGQDVNIYLVFGFWLNTTRKQLYKGRLDFTDYKRSKKDGVKCNTERVDFENEIRSKFDTRVTVTSNKDLANNTITPLAPWYLQLHSKQIIKIAQVEYDAASSTQYAELEDTGATWTQTWLQPDTNNLETAELEEVQQMPLALMRSNPVGSSLFNFKATEDGILLLDFKCYGKAFIDSSKITSADIHVQVERASVVINTLSTPLPYSFITVIKPDGSTAPNWVSGAVYNAGSVVRDGDALFRCKFNGFSSSTPPHSDTVNWEHTPYYSVNQFGTQAIYYNFGLLLQKDDQLYISVRLSHASIGGTTFTIDPDIYVDEYENSIIFKQYTEAQRSICKAHRIIDILNQCVYSITGKPNRVISNYYGTGGEGEKKAITNGYQIRGFDIDKRPLQIDLKTLLEGCQAIDNIGVGYKKINDEDYLIVEPMLSFMNKSRIIATIRNVYDYEENVLNDYVYNKLDIGFERYADQEKKANSIDDYMTEQTLNAPVKNIAQSISKKSKLIASPYVIENQRREQYKTNPSTSLTEDDDAFIITYNPKTIYKQIYYAAYPGPKEIWFSVDVGLVAGDVIVLKDNVYNNNVSFTVVSRVYSASGYGWVFAQTPTAVVGGQEMCTMEIVPPVIGSNTVIVAERNEPFETVSGTISPGTIYNARITPKRNAYRWGPLMNIGVIYKDGTDLLINTFTKINGEFSTKFLSTEPFKGYPGTSTVKENANILLSDYSNRDVPFTPINAPTFKAQLDYETIELIRSALFGETGDNSKDHGVLLVEDDNGIMWLMQVLKFEYEPKTQVGIFECAKIEQY